MAFQDVILTQKIEKLGAESDIVRVRAGYARNFLIPSGKAMEKTAANLGRLNRLKAKRAEREARMEQRHRRRADEARDEDVVGVVVQVLGRRHLLQHRSYQRHSHQHRRRPKLVL